MHASIRIFHCEYFKAISSEIESGTNALLKRGAVIDTNAKEAAERGSEKIKDIIVTEILYRVN